MAAFWTFCFHVLQWSKICPMDAWSSLVRIYSLGLPSACLLSWGGKLHRFNIIKGNIFPYKLFIEKITEKPIARTHQQLSLDRSKKSTTKRLLLWRTYFVWLGKKLMLQNSGDFSGSMARHAWIAEAVRRLLSWIQCTASIIKSMDRHCQLKAIT